MLGRVCCVRPPGRQGPVWSGPRLDSAVRDGVDATGVRTRTRSGRVALPPVGVLARSPRAWDAGLRSPGRRGLCAPAPRTRDCSLPCVLGGHGVPPRSQALACRRDSRPHAADSVSRDEEQELRSLSRPCVCPPSPRGPFSPAPGPSVGRCRGAQPQALASLPSLSAGWRPSQRRPEEWTARAWARPGQSTCRV